MIHTPIIASNGYKEYKWHVGENQERYSPNRGCNGIFFSVCIDICARLTRESSHLIPASVLPHSRRCGCPRLQDAHLQGKGLRTLSSFWESLGAIDNDKRCHSLFSQRHCAAQGMDAVSRAGSLLSRKGPHLQQVNSTGEASALTLGAHSWERKSGSCGGCHSPPRTSLERGIAVECIQELELLQVTTINI